MRIYLLLMAVAAVVTFLATPLARVLAQRTHAITAVRDRDVHTVPVPRLGGLAMLIGFACTLTIASQMPFLQPLFTGSTERLPWAILVSATVVCLLGVADDIWDLDWLTKLVGQVLAAGFLAWQGVQLIQFPIFGLTIGSSRLSLVVTVLVVVVAINAVNFVDGLDGLAAGVIAIGGTAFFAYTYILTRGDTPSDYSDLPTTIMACVVGVCLGFLPHNFFPARIFMGDSGAMFLGLTMSAASIYLTGQIDPARLDTAFPAFVPILLPVAVLILPLLDMGLAVIRRLKAGTSPFHPDRMHLHHRLLDFGHSHRRAVLIMYIWTAVLAFSAVSLAIPGVPVPVLVVGIAAGIALAVWATVRLPRQPLPKLGR
ncbi:MraY family glycosyltransferase [Pseudactinotalea sp.]|uniref:MraY family glycosyltransferase n=1 Tax=Pseudactinotalea sp. TaxID=1926260 RepID=UPI003B3A0958